MTAYGLLEGALRRDPAGSDGRCMRALLVRCGLIGCSGLVAVLAIAAALISPERAPVPAARTPAISPVLPAWIAVDHPLQMIALGASPFARFRPDYQARRRVDGGSRQDTLTFGSFSGSAPFLRLTLEHGTSVADAPLDLLVASARIAATAGIAVLRAGQPDALPSRLGLFAAAPMTLASAGTERQCLGFRLEGRPAVAVAGVACGPPGHGPERVDLACALDSLDLVSGGDAALRAFFDAAGRRAAGCSVTSGQRS